MGAPEMEFPEKPYSVEKPFVLSEGSLREPVIAVLSHPDLANNSMHAAQFNSQAQGRTYTMTPFYSVQELDGMGLPFACGCNARHTYLNPYAGAANAVLELASHIASVGGIPFCAQDNLNFGSPEKPEVMWQISETVKDMSDMCRRALHIPIVGGNDLIGWEWPDVGDIIAVVGETKAELGGSVLDAATSHGGASS